MDLHGTALGVATGDGAQVISNFAATSGGTYYVQVLLPLLGDYSLVVTRNAVFDTETNDPQVNAQPLGVSQAHLCRPQGVSIGNNLEGLICQRVGGYRPPDSAAVGNNFVVEIVNIQIRVYDKTSGTILVALQSFFGAFSGGDPYVVYDDTADRWYVSSFDSVHASEDETYQRSAVSS